MPVAETRTDTRETILAATRRLLARYGYKKMTMDDVAQEAGIGKGTIYLHFPSKEELVLSHIDDVVLRVVARLHEIAAEKRPARRRLEAMLVERVMMRFDAVQNYTTSLNEMFAAIRPSLMQRRKRHMELEAVALAEVLREGRSAGDFTFRDASETAAAMLTASNSMLPYSLSARELGKRSEVEGQVRMIAALLVGGVQRHP